MMRKETLARSAGLAMGVAVLVAIALFAFVRDGGSVSAQAEPQMGFLLQGGGYPIGDCTQDCTVLPGEGFFLSITASGLPAGGYTSFQTEVFPGGLTYRPGECDAEVLIDPLALCLGPVVPELGPIHKPLPPTSFGHGGVTGLGLTPPPSTSSPLVQVRLTCPEEGTYEVVMASRAAVAGARPVGSWFKDVDGETVDVASVGTRVLTIGSTDNPDDTVTTDIPIAAAMTVICEARAEPTDEPTGPSDATATPGPQLPTTGAPGSVAGSGTSPVLWAVLGVLLAGALAGLGTFGWQVGRRGRSL